MGSSVRVCLRSRTAHEFPSMLMPMLWAGAKRLQLSQGLWIHGVLRAAAALEQANHRTECVGRLCLPACADFGQPEGKPRPGIVWPKPDRRIERRQSFGMATEQNHRFAQIELRLGALRLLRH